MAPLMPALDAAGGPARWSSGSHQCGALSGAFRGLADAADPFRSLAHCLRLVPRTGAPLPVQDHPRCRN